MYYTQDEFLALMDAIESDGGTHLDKLHEDRPCDLKIDPELLRKNKTTAIPYCNEMALFEIPYKPMGDHPEGTVALIEVCAVDDWMGRWPRYADAGAEGSP